MPWFYISQQKNQNNDTISLKKLLLWQEKCLIVNYYWILYNIMAKSLTLLIDALFLAIFNHVGNTDVGHRRQPLILKLACHTYDVIYIYIYIYVIYIYSYYYYHYYYKAWLENEENYVLSYFICSDPDDVLKTKTFGHSSFYYPPIFLCFISGKRFFVTTFSCTMLLQKYELINFYYLFENIIFS